MSRARASTRAAMVASSNTMDLTGRPPVRRNTSGEVSIDPNCFRAREWEPERRTADAGDPEKLILLSEHRPGGPLAQGDPLFLEASDHQPPAWPAQRLELFAPFPAANRQRIEGEPGASTPPLLLRRRSPALP